MRPARRAGKDPACPSPAPRQSGSPIYWPGRRRRAACLDQMIVLEILDVTQLCRNFPAAPVFGVVSPPDVGGGIRTAGMSARGADRDSFWPCSVRYRQPSFRPGWDSVERPLRCLPRFRRRRRQRPLWRSGATLMRPGLRSQCPTSGSPAAVEVCAWPENSSSLARLIILFGGARPRSHFRHRRWLVRTGGSKRS